MNKLNNIFYWINTQKITFEPFESVILENSDNKINDLIKIYSKKGFFWDKLNKKLFYLFIKKNKITSSSIISTKYENGLFYIKRKEWDKLVDLVFSVEDIKRSAAQKIENRIIDITNAVKAIYKKNDFGITTLEIDNDDKVTEELISDYNLNNNLKGLNLIDLKNLLGAEKQKSVKLYKLTGETQQSIRILQFEIEHYTAATSRTEWSSRIHSMKDEDIGLIVISLIDKMSYIEIFDYLKKLHIDMDDDIFHWNYKKSELVSDTNINLFTQLYEKTFEKLKSDNAENKYFIDLIRIMSWRGEKIDNLLTKITNPFDSYDDAEWDPIFRDMWMVNKVMIYVMQKPWGVFENIIKEKNWIDKIEVKDEKLKWKTPSWIMTEAQTVFWKLAKKSWKTWNELLKSMNFDKLIGITKPYNELTLDEKIKIWAVFRMIEITKDITKEDIEDEPNILMDRLNNTMKESFDWINESLEDQFDRDNWFAWSDAEDLGLTGELAEIFDLYQDINWHLLFDLSDDNWFNNFTWTWTATLALSIIAAWVFMEWLAAWSWIVAILLAWAAAWAIGGLIANLFNKKWYDSLGEWAWDVLLTTVADALLWALFFLWSVKFWSSAKIFKDKAIDILSLKWYDKKNLFDVVLFWWLETLTNAIILSPIISNEVKHKFVENHYDPEKENYQALIKKINSQKLA